MGRVRDLLFERIDQAQAGDKDAARELLWDGYGSFVSDCGEEAIQYAENHNWAIIPQDPSTKRPLVRWKEFKDEGRRPTLGQLADWYAHWRKAGAILLLGPVSGVFAVDVDGREGHDALLAHVGEVPDAPRSTRGKKYRYHLLFRHPEHLKTNARHTPWHPQLEFRGHGGYIVVPPSCHPSGNRYRWSPGYSPEEMELPEIPEPIFEALKQRETELQHRKQPVEANASKPADVVSVREIPGLTKSTMRFLAGQFANGPGWNRRLFAAACDMTGNRIDEDQATRLLLKGARPWNEEEREKALSTIRSAYAVDRLPGRAFSQQRKFGRQPATTRIRVK